MRRIQPSFFSIVSWPLVGAVWSLIMIATGVLVALDAPGAVTAFTLGGLGAALVTATTRPARPRPPGTRPAPMHAQYLERATMLRDTQARVGTRLWLAVATVLMQLSITVAAISVIFDEGHTASWTVIGLVMASSLGLIGVLGIAREAVDPRGPAPADDDEPSPVRPPKRR